MAQELYTRTNQKLFFAGLALESMAKAADSQAMNAQGLIQAECHKRQGPLRAHRGTNPLLQGCSAFMVSADPVGTGLPRDGARSGPF